MIIVLPTLFPVVGKLKQSNYSLPLSTGLARIASWPAELVKLKDPIVESC